MDVHQAFLADIAANPDDDAPRLVYADWLDDHGDADRAAFIRSQCRLASRGPYHPDHWDLEAEAEQLLSANGKKWRKPLAKVTARVEFRRGFPHRIALPIAKFLTHGDMAHAAAPTLREWRVLQVALNWEQMLASPALERFSCLDAGYLRLGMARVQTLARAPRLAGLRELVLSGAKMRAGGIRDLCASPFLANLSSLVLASNDLGDLLTETLAASSHLTKLKHLDLSSNELTAAGFERLARWKGTAGLEELKILEYEGAGDDAARALASGEWPSLRSLALDLQEMGTAGLDALAGCASLGRLRRLELRYTFGQSSRQLFQSPHLASLERLSLRAGGAPGDLEALAASAMLASLRSLMLVLPEEGANLRPVLASPSAAGLIDLTLTLSGEERDSRQLCGHLAESSRLANLRRLSLSGFTFDAECLRMLAGASHLAGLRELGLECVELNGTTAKILAGSPHLAGLRRLTIRPTYQSDLKACEILQERFGDRVKLAR